MKAKTYKVTGHRPFENNCLSVNIVTADSPELAKKSMVDFYGYRNEDSDGQMKPNVIVDEVIEVKS